MNTKQANGKCTPVNYELLYSLAEGSGFNLISSKEDYYTREVMGNEIMEHTRDIMEYHFGVISSGDKGLTIKFQYSNRSHESPVSDSQTDIDFSQLIGAKTGFVISTTGKLSDFWGFDKLPKIEILDQQASIGKHQYINEIKELFPKLPDRPIPIGGTWTDKRIFKEPVKDGTMIFTREFVYTLLEETKKDGVDCLKIEFQFTSHVDGKLGSDDIEFTLELSGKGSEILFFAHKAGMFLSREGHSILEGSAENTRYGLSIPMKHNYKTRIQVELLPAYQFTQVDNRTIEQILFDEIEIEGIETGIKRYHELRNDYPDEQGFDETLLGDLGGKFLKSGKIYEALRILKENIDVFPNSSRVYYTYAEACFLAGKIEEAIDNYRKAFELSDYEPAVWNRLGEAYAKLGDKEKEIAYCIEAFDYVSNPRKFYETYDDDRPFNIWDEQVAWDKLIETYLKYGDITKAQETLKDVMGKYPGIVFWNARKRFLEIGVAVQEIDDGWELASLEELGIDPSRIDELKRQILEGTYRKINSVVIVKDGKLLVDEYFNFADRYKIHDVRSATKTLNSIMAGIAIDKGYINSVNENLMAYFPDHERGEDWDVRKDQITLKHLLTMSSGLDAYESDPKSPGNEIALLSSENYVPLVLNLPVVADPGEKFIYGSANSSLMGEVVSRATGMAFTDFTRENLFEPLGIRNYKWYLMPDGKAWTSCFIRMLPRDMAKIGQLYLNEGTWNGQRIVSEAWVSESTSDHIVSIPSMGMRYGYHWHIEKFGVFENTEIFSFSARGNGGNELHVFPMLDLVVVFTSSAYDTLHSHFQPGEMLVKYILPTFSQRK